ncbi:MAG: DUF1853 family protein [Pseudomonadales bacterium]|nr:DUF1853 family protein [Pseudomonadales bacterium]
MSATPNTDAELAAINYALDLVAALQLPELSRSNISHDDCYGTTLAETLDREFEQQQWQPVLEVMQHDELKAGRRLRLGVYYERLWLHLFNQYPKLQVLVANLQVFEKKQTVGEFDFILQREQQLIHHEIAIKFYLDTAALFSSQTWHADFTAEDFLLGPNSQDSLSRKFSHTLNKQLKLGKTPAGRAAIQQALGNHEAIDLDTLKTSYSIKGYIFHHITSCPWQQHKASPPALWLYLDEVDLFDQQLSATEYDWAILAKPDWLSQIHPIASIEVIARQQAVNSCVIKERLNALLHNKRSPIMLTAFRPLSESTYKSTHKSKHIDTLISALNLNFQQANELVEEVFRCFIAPRTWPGLEQPLFKS